jgi:cation:H+ antiporter
MRSPFASRCDGPPNRTPSRRLRLRCSPVSDLAAIGLLVLAIVLIVVGAEMFFAGLLRAAGALGVAPFAIVVVISGLEIENVAAGIAANASGLPGAAAGTFLGGTTFLALGVSGLGALIAPIRAELPGRVLVWTAVSPLPLVALSLDGELSRLDGGLLVAWFGLALVAVVRAGRSLLSPEDAQPKPAAGGEARGFARALAPLVGGVALLGAGGEGLGEGIRRVVERLGVSQTLLGNTVIAAGVEGEEVARIAVPARRGRGDIALGNIVGTIVHFVALNAGVIALVKPLELDADTLHLHLPVAVAATSTLCVVLTIRSGLGRAEGAALLALYAAYVGASVSVGV